MAINKTISRQKLESIQGGMALFYTPQSSHETMLVEIPSQSTIPSPKQSIQMYGVKTGEQLLIYTISTK